jgi:hypothetical protein
MCKIISVRLLKLYIIYYGGFATLLSKVYFKIEMILYLNVSSINQSKLSQSTSIQVKRMSFNCANPEFHVPHKPYYLRETTDALEEICSVTDNLQNVPDQFKMLEFQLQLPYKDNMIYGQFDGPSNIAVIDKVNGVDGFFLKKTIHETVIDFIWFQEENCQYLFWGSSKERVIDAMNRIRSRIIKCVKNCKPETELDEACPPSPLPSQQIFRSIGEAHYNDESYSDDE